MADLAATLSSNSQVIDNTGIKGLWDIDVTVETPLSQHTDDPGEQASHEFEYHRNFNSAFEKALGLSIDLGKFKKMPMPFIVVDHAELPTPN